LNGLCQVRVCLGTLLTGPRARVVRKLVLDCSSDDTGTGCLVKTFPAFGTGDGRSRDGNFACGTRWFIWILLDVGRPLTPEVLWGIGVVDAEFPLRIDVILADEGACRLAVASLIWWQRNAFLHQPQMESTGFFAGDFRFVGDCAGDFRLAGDFRFRGGISAFRVLFWRRVFGGPGFDSMSPQSSRSEPAPCLQSRGMGAGNSPSGCKNT
jgi:hypothetical protein